MRNAHKIVFISHKYKQFVLDKYIPQIDRLAILNKTIVIPNGIDDFWLSNIYTRNVKPKLPIKLLYVGNFTKNKNIHVTIDAVIRLINEGMDISFTIVGGGGGYENKIKTLASRYSKNFNIIGRVTDKSKLLQIYRGHDIFVMPSKHETFGLVYLEAISQGLPIIYTKGQGVDGFFNDGDVGYSVKANDVLDLMEKIKIIKTEYSTLTNKGDSLSERFSWGKICNQYVEIYNSMKG